MKRLIAGCVLAVASLATSDAWAQGCSICTKTAQNLDAKSAHGLNGGIIYLAFLPLGIIGTVTFLWWRGRRTA